MALGKCFACGETFNRNTNELLRRYKQLYEEKGIIVYYYKLSETDSIKITRKEYFKQIYETEIKPNLQNGATYACISEYTHV